MATFTIDWQETAPAECRGAAVTVGNFDGVHRGHAALVATVRDQAARLGGPAVVLTFDPHPRDLLRPDLAAPPLTTADDRARLLHEAGADHVAVLRTTPDLLHLTATEFFTQVLQERLAVKALAEGQSFGFGHNREGNIDTLTELCRAAAVPLTVVPPVVIDGGEAASSRVRACLLRGDIEEAAKVLGRPYRLHGTTAVGRRRGRTLGFPTANLDPLANLAPGDGVYAVRVYIGQEMWPAAANVGPNPTFGENARKVEVHLIGFRGDLYGQPLAVDFVRRLRDTRPFQGPEDLIRQLQRDVEQAWQALSVEPRPKGERERGRFTMSDDAALRQRVARVVSEEVAPALEMDGTAVEVLDVSDGVVRVRLHGGCASCPGSVYAVVTGIEEELRKRIPEVRYLEVAP